MKDYFYLYQKVHFFSKESDFLEHNRLKQYAFYQSNKTDLNLQMKNHFPTVKPPVNPAKTPEDFHLE